MSASSGRLPRVSLLVLFFVWLWVIAGNQLTIIGDEGIYLDGGVRASHGEVPYRDFFVLTGPGAFWVRGILFKAFGVSLAPARLLLVVELVLMAMLIYWLVSRLAPRSYGVCAAICFLAFGTASPSFLQSDHRWDSSALALLAVALLVAARDRKTPWLYGVGGVAAAMAAWTTPTVLLLLVAQTLWLWWSEESKRPLVAYAAGVGACSATAVAVLYAQGGLAPMLHHMVWSGANYAGANRVPYGSVHGGFLGMIEAVEGPAVVVAAVIAGVLVLPAVLPFLNLAGWGLRLRRALFERGSLVALLLACSLALVAACYPRWDAAHLTIVSPLSYVLAAALAARVLPPLLRVSLAILLLMIGGVLCWYSIAHVLSLETIETRVGTLRVSSEDAEVIERLQARIKPGDKLFVFPYVPMLYFVTRAQNVTRYTHLQPGMMTALDERAALDDLRANPPRWVVYADVPPEAYLVIWPSSDPARLRMPLLEQYLRSAFVEIERYRHPRIDLALLEPSSARNPAPDERQ